MQTRWYGISLQNAVVAMLVKCALNSKEIIDSVTSKAPPHHNTTSSMLHGRNRTCGDHQLIYSASHKDLSDQRTDFNRFTVHCSCFLTQASLFLLLESLSRGFFAAIRPRRPDSLSLIWTVDVEMCLLLELWGAVNSIELILCSRGNSGSSFPVVVLMRVSFIIETFKVLNVPDWLTFMS